MRIGLYLARLEETPAADAGVFTEAERHYCQSRPHPPSHLAARYAAKKATLLALTGRSDGGSSPGDDLPSLSEIEVLRERGRAPRIRFTGKSRPWGASDAWVSLTHSGIYAVALVVIE